MPLFGEAKRKYDREYVATRRAAWFKDKACVKCGSIERLENHHIDPVTKISHNVWTWAEVRREEELAKCEILCHDCHVIETMFRGGPRDTTHGSSNFWNQRRCRCPVCKRWHRDEMRKHRQKI